MSAEWLDTRSPLDYYFQRMDRLPRNMLPTHQLGYLLRHNFVYVQQLSAYIEYAGIKGLRNLRGFGREAPLQVLALTERFPDFPLAVATLRCDISIHGARTISAGTVLTDLALHPMGFMVGVARGLLLVADQYIPIFSEDLEIPLPPSGYKVDVDIQPDKG